MDTRGRVMASDGESTMSTEYDPSKDYRNWWTLGSTIRFNGPDGERLEGEIVRVYFGGGSFHVLAHPRLTLKAITWKWCGDIRIASGCDYGRVPKRGPWTARRRAAEKGLPDGVGGVAAT